MEKPVAAACPEPPGLSRYDLPRTSSSGASSNSAHSGHAGYGSAGPGAGISPLDANLDRQPDAASRTVPKITGPTTKRAALPAQQNAQRQAQAKASGTQCSGARMPPAGSMMFGGNNAFTPMYVGNVDHGSSAMVGGGFVGQFSAPRSAQSGGPLVNLRTYVEAFDPRGLAPPSETMSTQLGFARRGPLQLNAATNSSMSACFEDPRMLRQGHCLPSHLGTGVYQEGVGHDGSAFDVSLPGALMHMGCDAAQPNFVLHGSMPEAMFFDASRFGRIAGDVDYPATLLGTATTSGAEAGMFANANADGSFRSPVARETAKRGPRRQESDRAEGKGHPKSGQGASISRDQPPSTSDVAEDSQVVIEDTLVEEPDVPDTKLGGSAPAPQKTALPQPSNEGSTATPGAAAASVPGNAKRKGLSDKALEMFKKFEKIVKDEGCVSDITRDVFRKKMIEMPCVSAAAVASGKKTDPDNIFDFMAAKSWQRPVAALNVDFRPQRKCAPGRKDKKRHEDATAAAAALLAHSPSQTKVRDQKFEQKARDQNVELKDFEQCVEHEEVNSNPKHVDRDQNLDHKLCDQHLEQKAYDQSVDQKSCEQSSEMKSCDQNLEQEHCEQDLEQKKCTHNPAQKDCAQSVEQQQETKATTKLFYTKFELRQSYAMFHAEDDEKADVPGAKLGVASSAQEKSPMPKSAEDVADASAVLLMPTMERVSMDVDICKSLHSGVLASLHLDSVKKVSLDASGLPAILRNCRTVQRESTSECPAAPLEAAVPLPRFF